MFHSSDAAALTNTPAPTSALKPADGAGLREVAARFQGALPHIAIRQIVTTIVPLIALIAAMHTGLAFGWWPLLVLGIPAAALTVRTFIIQHDCGHGSFFRSRRINDWLGRACSLLTLTPYSHWRRHHAQHHGGWNDLDRRDASGLDIYSSCMTVDEYNAMGSWRRRLHRIARHQAVSLLALPPLIFLGLYRMPYDAPSNWRAERRGVHLTNAALVALHGSLALMLGFAPVAAVLLAVVVPASIIGVWLFSLQHHFEATHWARHADWNPVDAALRGTSFLRLPRLLQWLTGNIGFHHVHHASPRVPNYRLEACHDAHPAFAVAPVLTLADGLRASRHALWDEARGRMVTFAEATRQGKLIPA
jgi:omega-6 fatty acid desaturase (delta-12 desaturase)